MIIFPEISIYFISENLITLLGIIWPVILINYQYEFLFELLKCLVVAYSYCNKWWGLMGF